MQSKGHVLVGGCIGWVDSDMIIPIFYMQLVLVRYPNSIFFETITSYLLQIESRGIIYSYIYYWKKIWSWNIHLTQKWYSINCNNIDQQYIWRCLRITTNVYQTSIENNLYLNRILCRPHASFHSWHASSHIFIFF